MVVLSEGMQMNFTSPKLCTCKNNIVFMSITLAKQTSSLKYATV